MSTSSKVILSDVLGKSQAIHIFSGFTRDIDQVSKRLDDAAQNATILAPANDAIMKLPSKPWEDPKDYAEFGESAYNGDSGADKAQENLKRFVEAHIVVGSPWNEREKRETLTGKTIWFEKVDGKTIILPKGIEVTSIASRVANGEVWILNGVLDYTK
ncbi:hypothetical protein P152DRAFT_397808 [Eremomyces bilateralis CBS 781.70]|uniref:FAS1 domain-containing protein n=1 Tax=Eremomyces bilateralis CBS 781.70 TaxID=1392243 RepID=A0A6G1G2Y2_9PEZI|nr:uncharacterized protein P152DRAFT_397808 [Eremomyces bilateralis CBS 781.70]KAF1812403.1 hypothetical protein P152DRAFT_397808 [Eremomyces bilateralis CBS 781.70]